MNIDGKAYRTIWLNQDGKSVEIIDQTKLPHVFETVTLRDLDGAARHRYHGRSRGAPLIGATAAYGVALALMSDASDEGLDRACDVLAATRPTAINLRWALDEMTKAVRNQPRDKRVAAAFARAAQSATRMSRPTVGSASMARADPRRRREEGRGDGQRPHRSQRRMARDRRLGRALAPIYVPMTKASKWTRGWEMQARAIRRLVTAFELSARRAPHADLRNAGGASHGEEAVDLCIVGTDRTRRPATSPIRSAPI